MKWVFWWYGQITLVGYCNMWFPVNMGETKQRNKIVLNRCSCKSGPGMKKKRGGV